MGRRSVRGTPYHLTASTADPELIVHVLAPSLMSSVVQKTILDCPSFLVHVAFAPTAHGFRALALMIDRRCLEMAVLLIWSRAKGGRKEEADLGVAEWRIPVWRVEREENRRERGRHRATDEHAGEVRKEHAVRDRGDERKQCVIQKGGGRTPSYRTTT